MAVATKKKNTNIETKVEPKVEPKVETKNESTQPIQPIQSTREVELENELKQMKDMFMQMMNKQQELESKLSTKTTYTETIKSDKHGKQTKFDEHDDDYVDMDDIPFKTFIKVMSLTPNVLTLATEGSGSGTLYNFTKFGEVQHIMYEDLAKIIHNNDSFAKKGKFVILNKQVQKLHSLANLYESFLTKEQIEEILNFSSKNVVDLFQHANKSMQETIVRMLVDKIVNNEENVDFNILKKLSDVYGRDIYEMAKESKELINNR